MSGTLGFHIQSEYKNTSTKNADRYLFPSKTREIG